MTFAKRLQQARIANKMNRQQLADKIARSAETVKAWELGRHVPGQTIIDRLEVLLGVESGFLLQGDADIGSVIDELEIGLAGASVSDRRRVAAILRELAGLVKKK